MTTTATMTASDSIPIETHHEDMIHDAQLDYYGKRLATCSSDRTVKVFDVIDGEPQKSSGGQVLKGHTGPVWQVAWAHPKYGHILASCSYDGKVLIWKEQQHQNSTSGTWTKIKEHNLHSASVNSISWAPHELGAILACASSDGKLSVLTFKNDGSWDADIFNGHAIGCNAVSWAPAVLPGSLISPIPPTNASNPSLPAPSASSQPTSQPASTTNNTTNPNITPSTTALSTTTPTSTTTQYTKRFASAGCDNLVRLWAFHPASSTWVEECTLSAHTDWVRDVAWAPNVGLPRAYIATAGQDKMVYVWTKDGTNGAWVKTALDPSSISSSTPVPSQTVAATAGGAVAGAGAAGGKFPDVVWRVSWSLAGNVLAVSCGDGKVTLWKESLKGAWECVNELAS